MQLVPVYVALVVGYVDAVYLETLRISGLAIEGTPSEASRADEVEEGDLPRADEEVVESPTIENGYHETTNPECPTRHAVMPTMGTTPSGTTLGLAVV